MTSSLHDVRFLDSQRPFRLRRATCAEELRKVVSYTELAAHYHRISQLSHVKAITGWDEAVMMPHGGGDARAEAMATLEGLIHGLSTDPRVGDWLERAREAPLDETSRASLRENERV
jgi:carboxypeptidase Taq